jgi:serine/threonine protein kinase/tetratricopeptide (TPR) repeat protein
MVGQTISHYKILEKLGEGGMGVVYRAHDTKLDRDVALKFLPPNLTASPEELTRFEQEAKAISALNHPNIATIYDVDEVNGQRYLVLEYIPCGTLKSRLKQLKSEDKDFSVSEVLDYGVQIAEGLAHAHRHGIIHRDVKTENMMLTGEGKVKLTDFGLAKLRGSVQITKTGSTLGTAAYMSPEQIRGEEIDQRSDIFSLGIVLYELVTSHLPFRGEFEAALSYSILNENPPSIKSLRQNVPQALEQIINRCLEKDKSKRYQIANEIISELKNVERDLSRSTKRSEDRSTNMRWIVAAAVVVLAVLGIYLFYPKSVPTLVKNKSVAVLPFKNLSDSKEDEYFSDGITDDIIAQLSKIADLKVISRTSVMQYKGVSKNVREIGRELDIGTVLEGSVRRAGNQIRIVAQLIDASNEGHLWADTYDKEMTQIFAIQSDVAQRIAAALEARLSLAEKGRIEKKQTENTEAYQLYLKGRFYWNKRTVPDLQKSIEYFDQAIEKDQYYALAFSGLANSYVVLPAFGLSAREYYQKAQQAATKALEFDSTLAEVHTVLGNIKENQYDWTNAESEYKRAIELNPSYPTAHQWYSGLLVTLGRFNDAITEAKRAAELDPLSLIINYNLCTTLLYMRQYEQAIDQCNKGIELDPNFPWSYYARGMVTEVQGKLDEAIKDYQKARLFSHNDPSTLGDIGRSCARVGRKEDALKTLRELREYYKQGYSVSLHIANVYYGLGDKERTFEWLGRSIQDEAGLSVDSNNPLWDDIRSDPRFIALLKKIGLEK